jgi:hypothetical protein
MVEVDATIPLTGPHGPVTLLEVFEGRRQLIAYYFMWQDCQPKPSWSPAALGFARVIRGGVARGLRRFATVASEVRPFPRVGRTRAMATAARDRLARTLRGDAQAAFSVELRSIVPARSHDLRNPRRRVAALFVDTGLTWAVACPATRVKLSGITAPVWAARTPA